MKKSDMETDFIIQTCDVCYGNKRVYKDVYGNESPDIPYVVFSGDRIPETTTCSRCEGMGRIYRKFEAA